MSPYDLALAERARSDLTRLSSEQRLAFEHIIRLLLTDPTLANPLVFEAPAIPALDASEFALIWRDVMVGFGIVPPNVVEVRTIGHRV